MIANLLTDRELSLMLELLNTEQSEVRHELHHTDSMALKEDLQHRLKSVERIIERLRSLQADQQSVME